MPNNEEKQYVAVKPASLTGPALIMGIAAVLVTLLVNQDQKIEDHRDQKIHPQAGERMAAVETKQKEDEKRLTRMEKRNDLIHDKLDNFLWEYLKNKEIIERAK